jgi:exonuclease SbcC
MKILAIRGKNLASLSAAFEIDFQSEPLASAGLFAITGPTGSGKSTLLDALCVALYERTPRLSKATARGEVIPDVGDNTVAPGDVRTLLRRGAGEGFAEVDFVGSDAVAYRARWSVRRSRLRADGKLQASEVTLLRITDGQRLGDHTKTETLRLIEQRIGLSFEQFTRAVLLAQNDFATFLKAPDDERAELLQTLTGTETFAELSRQAFARMKAERELLDRLHAQRKDQLPLELSVRAEKDAALLAQTEAAGLLAAHKAGIEEHLRWHQQWQQRQAEQQDARTRQEAAVAASQQAVPRQAHLQLLEQVQAARPLRTEQERLTLACDQAVQTESQARAELALARDEAQERELAQGAAVQQLAASDAAKAEAQPGINQARELDASLATLAPRHLAALQAQAEAQAQADQALAAKAATEVQINAQQQQLQVAQEWLRAQAPLRPLAEGWQLWEALLGQAQAHRADQKACEQELADLAQQATAMALAWTTAQAALQQTSQAAADSARLLAEQTQRCAATDAGQLARDRHALEEVRDQLQAAALLWQRRCEVRAARIQLQAQQHTENTALQECEAALQECTRNLPLREAELQASEQALQLAQLAASEGAEALRDSLQPEQPCPVCGARTHPYAEHAPVVGAMLQSLQTHVTERRIALRQVQGAAVRASTGQASAAKALAQFAREQTTLETRHAALLAEWTALALHDALEAVALAEREGWLQQRQNAARADLQALARQEAELHANLQRRDAAQAQLNVANKSQEQAREATLALQLRASAIAQSTQAAERQRTLLAQQLEQALGQLDAAFDAPDWRERWSKSPQDFVAHCRSQAQAWTEQQARSNTLVRSLENLQVERGAAEAACLQATQQLQVQTTACATEAEHLLALRQQRAALLQGKAVAQVEQTLQTAMLQARATLEAAQSAWQHAQGEVQRLQEALRQAEMQRAELRAGLDAAHQALDDWLQDFNTGRTDSAGVAGVAGAAVQPVSVLLPDALDALLAIALPWIATERDALHTLHNAEAAAHAVLETRTLSLQQHEAAKTTTESAEALQQALQQASIDLSAATSALSTLQLELALDDQRLQQSEALRLQIDQQTAAARVWSQLGELIGSADGKKFRNFAQQLTLDILLGYGNRHLQSLSSRYQLRRIQDSLGLLVVDLDMGDELRSVHSLSGGESFLVSLAMALGLASLSSHRVRVESLFIDEGFGSLDADSLRVAMDALDRLQSLGRKVGVISHVAEMTERIGTRVQVQRLSGAASRIVVTGG